MITIDEVIEDGHLDRPCWLLVTDEIGHRVFPAKSFAPIYRGSGMKVYVGTQFPVMFVNDLPYPVNPAQIAIYDVALDHVTIVKSGLELEVPAHGTMTVNIAPQAFDPLRIN